MTAMLVAGVAVALVALSRSGAMTIDPDKLPEGVRELLRSGAAAAKGLSNIPTDPTHLRRLVWLATVDAKLAAALREKWPQARRTSAYRAPAVNAAVDGAPGSLHAQGLAVDYTDGGATGDYRPWLLHVRELVQRGEIPAPIEVIAETHPPHLHVGFRDPVDGEPKTTRWLAERGDRSKGEKRKLVVV